MISVDKPTTAICANCGREQTLDNMQRRYYENGYWEHVCADQITCEPTMAIIIKQMAKRKGRKNEQGIFTRTARARS